jgi:predicted  nucleic acid-binding Zn-ribbon protein
MKAIFYALALLVTGAAAFFSYQNVGKYKVQKEEKEATIVKNDDLTKKKTKQQTDLDEEKLALETANRDRESVKQSISSLQSKGKALVREIAALNATLEEQKAKFAELEKTKAAVNEIAKDANVQDVGEIPGEIAKLEAEKAAKTKELEELNTGNESLEKNVAKNQEEISRLAERDASRDTRIRRNAMESVVTAVNEDWGFVIIGAGSNTGFTPQTKLLVKREGRLIGMVKPSSIEPSQVVAEIDADSIAPGVRIQPGDRVILGEPASN